MTLQMVFHCRGFQDSKSGEKIKVFVYFEDCINDLQQCNCDLFPLSQQGGIITFHGLRHPYDAMGILICNLDFYKFIICFCTIGEKVSGQPIFN